jgi:hypothetical protein
LIFDGVARHPLRIDGKCQPRLSWKERSESSIRNVPIIVVQGGPAIATLSDPKGFRAKAPIAWADACFARSPILYWRYQCRTSEVSADWTTV